MKVSVHIQHIDPPLENGSVPDSRNGLDHEVPG